MCHVYEVRMYDDDSFPLDFSEKNHSVYGQLDIRVSVMNQWLTLFPVTHYCGCAVQKKWFSKNSRHSREQPNSERKKKKKDCSATKLKCKINGEIRKHEFCVWYGRKRNYTIGHCVVFAAQDCRAALLFCQNELINVMMSKSNTDLANKNYNNK